MKIKQAKDYFADGMIISFGAVRDPQAPGCWLLVIDGRFGKKWIFETALGQERSFARLDTLVSQVEQIAGRVTSLRFAV